MKRDRFEGTEGSIVYRRWDPATAPERIVLLAHGYGEHIGRYDHVAAALTTGGSVVYGPDHIGHGESDGDRALVTDFEHLIDDLHTVAEIARDEHPGLPVVLVGHSMGGLIATRYAQRYGDELRGLVLSGPALDWGVGAAMLARDEIPDTPIDPEVLSRDTSVGEAYAADPLVYHGPFQRPTVEQLVAAIRRANAEADRITMPVLLVHGGNDQLVPAGPAREAVEGFPAADKAIYVYSGGRHEMFNETNRDEVISEVVRFARRVTPSALPRDT